MSADSLAGDFFLDDPEVRDALERSGAGDLVFEPAAWVIGAKADGFEFQAASLGKGGPVSPMLVPRESRLVRYVPADAAIYLSTTDIAGTWDRVMTSARPEIDRAIRSEGEYESLDDALREAGREIGIQSIEDLVELLNGETSFAFWFPKGSEEDAEGVMLAEVDQGRAEALLKQISATSAWGTPQTKKVNGKDMTWFKDQDGDETAYAFLDGNLVLGTRAGVSAVYLVPNRASMSVMMTRGSPITSRARSMRAPSGAGASVFSGFPGETSHQTRSSPSRFSASRVRWA